MGLSSTSCPITWASIPHQHWWRDVLENGPSSPYARYFDIDWRPVKPELRDKVLLPILGDQYGDRARTRRVAIRYEDGAFVVRYYERNLPLDPRQQPLVLVAALDRADGRASATTSRTCRNFVSARSRSAADDRADRRRRRRRHAAARMRGAPCSSGWSRSSADRARVREHIASACRRSTDSRASRGASIDCTPTRGAGLPPRVLAHGVRRDQLPALLRRQRSRWAAHGGSRACSPIRTHCCSISCEEARHRHPHRSSRRSVRSGRVFPRRCAAPRASGCGDDGVYVVAEKILAQGRAAARRLEGARDHGLWRPERCSTACSCIRRAWPTCAASTGGFTDPDESPADTSYDSKKFMMRTALASELNVLSRTL